MTLTVLFFLSLFSLLGLVYLTLRVEIQAARERRAVEQQQIMLGQLRPETRR